MDHSSSTRSHSYIDLSSSSDDDEEEEFSLAETSETEEEDDTSSTLRRGPIRYGQHHSRWGEDNKTGTIQENLATKLIKREVSL